MVNNKGSKYKWYILFLAAGGNGVLGLLGMCMPVLFKEISVDLSLSLVQIGTVWSMVNLAGIFTTLPGGTLGDRFGVKRTIGLSCILSGLAGASRGLAGGFVSLAATMFLVGFLTAAIVPGIHKAAAIWFPRRQLGMANGIVMIGMGVGQTTGAMISATVLSPWLGSWRGVMYLYGGVVILLGILWLLSRSKPEGGELIDTHADVPSLRQSLSRLARIKNLWLVGLSAAGIMGCQAGSLGYLPLYLQGIGWDITSASAVVAVTGAVGMVAATPIAVLSDRLGSRKKVMIAATIVIAAAITVLPFLSGSMIWVAVIIAGLPMTGYLGLMVTVSTETEGVGIYAGTAMGLVLNIFRLGGIIAPPLGLSLAETNPKFAFFLWAAMAVAGLIGLLFVKDTGPRRG
jgi:ACS family glucarate transporter-like MFS transporter